MWLVSQITNILRTVLSHLFIKFIFFDVKALGNISLSCSINMMWIFLFASGSRGCNNSYLDPLCTIVLSMVLIVIFAVVLLEWWQISLWHDCIVVEAVVFNSCAAFTCDRSVSSPIENATCICTVGEGYFTGAVYLPTIPLYWSCIILCRFCHDVLFYLKGYVWIYGIHNILPGSEVVV